jgi:hypothetical protein
MTVAAKRDDDAPPGRGILEVEVDCSKSELTAGSPFAVYVEVTNPFDVPVDIVDVTTLLPPEISDLGGATARASDHGPLVAHAVSTGTTSLQDAKNLSLGSRTSPQLPTDAETLQPNNKTVRAFFLRHKRTIWLTPTSYELRIPIRYVVDGNPNSMFTEASIKIVPPLWYLVVGAIVGAIAGQVAKSLDGVVDTVNYSSAGEIWRGVADHLPATLLGLIVAVLAVIAVQKAKDAVLTIEDIFGGFLVGAAVVLAGTQAVDVVRDWNPTNATTPTPPAQETPGTPDAGQANTLYTIVGQPPALG